ncbi:MAG: hypothetical protein ACLTWO_06255 [Blautia massiliensis (ex Durand et al. 2017)]
MDTYLHFYLNVKANQSQGLQEELGLVYGHNRRAFLLEEGTMPGPQQNDFGTNVGEKQKVPLIDEYGEILKSNKA